MILRNLQLTESSDFAELFRDEANHTCVWFKFRTMVVGGYYLPPSLDLTICRESPVIASEFVEDQDRKVSLTGDLNLRMDHSRVTQSKIQGPSCGIQLRRWGSAGSS